MESDFGRRNASIRAETTCVLGEMVKTDYQIIIFPEKRNEKYQYMNFLYEKYFFSRVNAHSFEKNFFHLFTLTTYSRKDKAK